jgi:hypothetical protein
MSRKFGLFAALVVVLSSTQTRASLNLDNPITLSTEGVVGIKTAFQGDGGEDDTARLGYAQTILGLLQGGTAGAVLDPSENGHGHSIEYEANPAFNYAGTILGADPIQESFNYSGDQIVIPAGYAYVLIKYNGQNAGYVLYATGGEAALLPKFPQSIWVGKNDPEKEQYGISGWTGYYGTLTPNPSTGQVPEPASVAIWTLLSLCCGGFASKMRRRQK